VALEPALNPASAGAWLLSALVVACGPVCVLGLALVEMQPGNSRGRRSMDETIIPGVAG